MVKNDYDLVWILPGLQLWSQIVYWQALEHTHQLLQPKPHSGPWAAQPVEEDEDFVPFTDWHTSLHYIMYCIGVSD